MNLYHHFKIYPSGWEHPIKAQFICEAISFVFTMKSFPGLYFRLKKPIDNVVGLDCFQFEFDSDNGVYIKDGDMRFNHFMGEDILDSSTNVVGFIKDYLIKQGHQNLILKNLNP